MKTELPAMPKRDAVGEAAAKLAEIISKQKNLQVARGNAADELKDAMLNADRPSISIDGFTFILEEREAEEKVKVIAPR